MFVLEKLSYIQTFLYSCHKTRFPVICSQCPSILQSVLNTAMTWSVEAGLDKKILRDVLFNIWEDGFLHTCWIVPSDPGTETLLPMHVLPSIFVCIVGLSLSTTVFVSEILLHFKFRLSGQKSNRIKHSTTSDGWARDNMNGPQMISTDLPLSNRVLSQRQ